MPQPPDSQEQGVNCASLVSYPRSRSPAIADAPPVVSSPEGCGAAAPGAAPPDADVSQKQKRGRRGPPSLPASEKRTHTVSTRFNQDELHQLDILSASIGVRRGEYLRLACFDKLPPTIPELNKEVWLELSKAAGNLNQIAKKLHQESDFDVGEVEEMLSYFRHLLIDIGGDYESQS